MIAANGSNRPASEPVSALFQVPELRASRNRNSSAQKEVAATMLPRMKNAFAPEMTF